MVINQVSDSRAHTANDYDIADDFYDFYDVFIVFNAHNSLVELVLRRRKIFGGSWHNNLPPKSRVCGCCFVIYKTDYRTYADLDLIVSGGGVCHEQFAVPYI